MKIVEMKGSEVLPGKITCKTCNGTKRHKDVFGDVIACPHCHLVHQRNETIDAYNSVEIDGLEDELNNTIQEFLKEHNIHFMVFIGNDKWSGTSGAGKLLAKSIISQMPKWVVLRKGR